MCWAFLQGAGDVNSHPHICAASTLLMEPSPKPHGDCESRGRRGQRVRRKEGAVGEEGRGDMKENTEQEEVPGVLCLLVSCSRLCSCLQTVGLFSSEPWKEVLSSPTTTDLAQGTKKNVHSSPRQEDQRKPSLREHAAHCSQSSSWERERERRRLEGGKRVQGHPNVQCTPFSSE